jgi:hypothetical protein
MYQSPKDQARKMAETGKFTVADIAQDLKVSTQTINRWIGMRLMERPQMPRFVLYRFYDEYGHLLYIGQTSNWLDRMRAHARESWWMADVRQIRLEEYDSLHELKSVEAYAIRSEDPAYNFIHKVGA